MNGNNDNNSFWQTVPGILTALGTLFTAVVGGIVTLNGQGFFDKDPLPEPSKTPGQISSSPTPTPTPTKACEPSSGSTFDEAFIMERIRDKKVLFTEGQASNEDNSREGKTLDDVSSQDWGVEASISVNQANSSQNTPEKYFIIFVKDSTLVKIRTSGQTIEDSSLGKWSSIDDALCIKMNNGATYRFVPKE